MFLVGAQDLDRHHDLYTICKCISKVTRLIVQLGTCEHRIVTFFGNAMVKYKTISYRLTTATDEKLAENCHTEDRYGHRVKQAKLAARKVAVPSKIKEIKGRSKRRGLKSTSL
jgi:hypothetical protein